MNESSQAIHKNNITRRLDTQLRRAAKGQLMFVSQEDAAIIERRQLALKRSGTTDVGTRGLTKAQAGIDFQMCGSITSLDSRNVRTGMVQRMTQIFFKLLDVESGEVIWSNMYELNRAAADDVITVEGSDHEQVPCVRRARVTTRRLRQSPQFADGLPDLGSAVRIAPTERRFRALPRPRPGDRRAREHHVAHGHRHGRCADQRPQLLDADIVLIMRTRFSGDRGQTEPPSAWRTVHLPPRGATVYAESAISTASHKVQVDIHDANRGQQQFAPGQPYTPTQR